MEENPPKYVDVNRYFLEFIQNNFSCFRYISYCLLFIQFTILCFQSIMVVIHSLRKAVIRKQCIQTHCYFCDSNIIHD